MKQVFLSDLRDMGRRGGYTVRLLRRFPFSYTTARLKEDYIELQRVGIVEGEKKIIFLREPYSQNLLATIDTILLNKTLVAKRLVKEGKLVLSGRGYDRVDRTTG